MSNATSENDAKQEFIQGILPDIPLIMYGSGDVRPEEVDPSTAELVAILTAEYISKLVRKSVDAHDILTNGMGGVLPPKPYKKKMVQDWTQPLPIPKIKNRNGRKGEGESSADDGNIQMIQGVDIYPDRIRNTYATTPYMIGAQSFLFPCCHDAELYNRVQDLKSMQNNIQSTIIDSTIMDFIREEEDGYDHLAQSAFSWIKTEGGEPGAEEERRKENSRRLAVRTGLDAQIPGIDDLLLPSSCLNGGDEDSRDL
jgi:hypothetical protein